MDSRRVGYFAQIRLLSQQAKGASYNLLLLLRKDCLFCRQAECYGPPSVPFDQSGIHKEPSKLISRGHY